MSATRTVYLRHSFPWMGRHSGYERLADVLADQDSAVVLRGEQPGWLERRRLASRFWEARSNELYTWASTAAEVEVSAELERGGDLAHLLYLEQDYGLLSLHGTRFGAKVVGTAHQPPSWWRLHHERPERLSGLDGIIAVSQELAEFMEGYAPGRVRYIPHGIDTAFFQPSKQAPAGPPRLLMAGQWLRDFDCLAAVLDRVLARDASVEADLLVPRWRRTEPIMTRIARHRRVHWHAGVDDDALRGLYQRATVLVMPVLDCTANNAILEAMACGLPIVASDLPGVRDYTSPAFCDCTPVGEPEAMARAVMALLSMPDHAMAERRAAARDAAMALDWTRVAAQVRAFHAEVLRR